MGNVPTKDSSTGTGSRGVHSFTQHQVISEDAHSKVQIVEHPLTHELFALRRMSKQHIVATRQTQRILRERDLLESLDHPFILGLQFSFQDTYGVYMGVQLMKGGRLDEQMRGRWASEAVVRVWVAELACAVRYLHEEHMVVHGRVDMQNVWVDEDGHVALGGFEQGEHNGHVSDRDQETADGRDQSLIARDRDRDALLAPELQKGARPDYAGDWWGLGIIMYTCLFGHPPFRSPSHLETQRMILSSDVVFPVSTDLRVTTNCMSAIRGLLQKNPIDRLGYRASGVSRLRQHPFFATLDWSLVEARDVTVPFAVHTKCEPRESMFAEVGECMELHVPELEPRPELVELERKFVEFDYGEFVRFRAYVERRRGISAQAAECARAECVRVGEQGVQMGAGVAVGDVPLECLTLAGQPIVKPIAKKSVKRNAGLAIKSEGMRRSNSIVRTQGLRKVSIAVDDVDNLRRDSSVSTRDASSRLMRRTTSTAIARLKGKKRTPRAPEPACPNVLSQPPSFVPIDPHTWTQMATEQQNLARRYCTKMAQENQRLLANNLQEEDEEDELFQSTYSLTAASLLPAARRAGCRMRAKKGDVDVGLAMRREACKSSPDLNAPHGALYGRLTRHDAPSTPVLSGELTRHGVLSMVSVNELPSMSVSERPSMLSVSERPSMSSVSERPSMSSVSERPSMLSVSEQPSMLSVSEQPSMPSLNEQPSIPSLTERVARNKSSATSSLNNSNANTPSLTEQRTRRKAPNSHPLTQLTRHKGPSTASLHGPRRMHAGSRASVTVPRLQPIAAAWPTLLRTEPRVATRMARSPSTPISPMSDTEWDMLPEACDRFGLSSAAADVAKKAGCLPSRKRSF
ncbi:Serine/threonine kinase [Coemansia sp. RSA 1972]|nr:Serine/threonine kinase [Coemansia sp. RSA 1972]